MNSVALEKIYTKNGKSSFFGEGETVYNLGCGGKNFSGMIGVDIRNEEGVEIVCDLNEFPWPIDDNTADAVVAFHTLEHLDDLNRVMEEVWRILKPGGRLVVEVPYFRHAGAFQDPTHVHFFTSRTMDYFCANNKRETGRYSDITFKKVDFWLGWPVRSKNFIVRAFKNWIKNHQDFYDNYLSIFSPVKILVVELMAIKDEPRN